MEIAGKTTLVTGGARRVGRAIAIDLARSGANIIVHYNKSADMARRTVAEIEAVGARAIAVEADLAKSADLGTLVDAAAETFGGLDILVNSAATFESGRFEEITEAEWDHVHAVNLKAPFLLMQKAAPLLRAGHGVIINIADLSAFQAWPSYAHHATSKAGLVHLTRVAARALAPAIRVNCIAPGTVLPPDDYTGLGGDGTSDRRLVARPGRPEDVTSAVRYLITSDFVTGETLVVDGGRMLF